METLLHQALISIVEYQTSNTAAFAADEEKVFKWFRTLPKKKKQHYLNNIKLSELTKQVIKCCKNNWNENKNVDDISSTFVAVIIKTDSKKNDTYTCFPYGNVLRHSDNNNDVVVGTDKNGGNDHHLPSSLLKTFEIKFRKYILEQCQFVTHNNKAFLEQFYFNIFDNEYDKVKYKCYSSPSLATTTSFYDLYKNAKLPILNKIQVQLSRRDGATSRLPPSTLTMAEAATYLTCGLLTSFLAEDLYDCLKECYETTSSNTIIGGNGKRSNSATTTATANSNIHFMWNKISKPKKLELLCSLTSFDNFDQIHLNDIQNNASTNNHNLKKKKRKRIRITTIKKIKKK